MSSCHLSNLYWWKHVGKIHQCFSWFPPPNQILLIIKQVKTTLKAFFALANFKKFIYEASQVNTYCPTCNFGFINTEQFWLGTKHELQSPAGGGKGENSTTHTVDWDALSLTQMEDVCPSQAQRQTFILKNKDSQENLLPHSKIAVFIVAERLDGQRAYRLKKIWNTMRFVVLV